MAGVSGQGQPIAVQTISSHVPLPHKSRQTEGETVGISSTKLLPSGVRHWRGYDSVTGRPAAAQSAKLLIPE